MNKTILAMAVAVALAACQPQLPFAGERSAAADAAAPAQQAPDSPAPGAAAGAAAAGSDAELARLSRPPRGEESVCHTFSRRIAEFALHRGGDVEGFMEDLQDEFIGGKDNPFDMKRGLQQGLWNQRYFYGGHGGFRPEFDDAQRYPRGGNHQPGHFISVLSIAQQFGEEQARIAIAVAGDYDPGDEDDLRLSMVAIPLGVGLSDGTVTPADVAHRARALCRS